MSFEVDLLFKAQQFFRASGRSSMNEISVEDLLNAFKCEPKYHEFVNDQKKLKSFSDIVKKVHMQLVKEDEKNKKIKTLPFGSVQLPSNCTSAKSETISFNSESILDSTSQEPARKKSKTNEEQDQSTSQINSLSDQTENSSENNRVVSSTKKLTKKFAVKDLLNLNKQDVDNYEVKYPKDKFSCMIGIEKIKAQLKVYTDSFLQNMNFFRRKVVFIYGPEGCGKTLLANAIAGEVGYPMISVNLKKVDSEEKIKNIFEQAESAKPCFLLLEGIDKFGNKSDDSQSTRAEKNRVETLVEHIKELESKHSNVFVITTANKLDDVDISIRKNSFKFYLPLPDVKVKMSLLKKFTEQLIGYPHLLDDDKIDTAGLYLTFNVNFEELAYMTPGFSGSNLRNIFDNAIFIANSRMRKSCAETVFSNLEVGTIDFFEAVALEKPLVTADNSISVPEITWNSIGALNHVRNKLKSKILRRIRKPESSINLHSSKPEGVILFGPPGCGKTLIAKALANEGSLNFLYVRGPELINKYVGESERNVRILFERAQECSPCLIFFDEVDSICEKRGSEGGSTKIVEQLLVELDGVTNRDGVFVLGATNRLDRIDPAFLRENRFSVKLYIGLPSQEGRLEILKSITKEIPLANDINLEEISRDPRCNNFSGADLSTLVTNALDLLDDEIEASEMNSDVTLKCVAFRHFNKALSEVTPSVSEDDLKYHEHIAKQFLRL